MGERAVSDVVIYKGGVLSCSVCAPAAMTGPEVAAEVNRMEPTGISSDWEISKDAQFATGEPNPCPCNKEPEARRHWLLDV